MTGRITHVPEPTAACERPGGCLGRPKADVYRPGTVWTCIPRRQGDGLVLPWTGQKR